MQDNPKYKVSVVLCTYNGEQYLPDQLDSIVSQSYPLHEIIIQDDGSTDHTLDIAHQYAERYPIIHVIINDGEHGINQNFFSALSKSTGNLIAIADQDDIWEKDKILWQVAEMTDEVWLVGGLTCPFSNSPAVPIDYDSRIPNLSLIRMLYVGMMPGHTLLFRRELLDMRPDCTFFMYDLQIQAIAAAAGRIAYVPRILVHHRRHADAATYLPPQDRRRTLGGGYHALISAWRIYKKLRPQIKRRFTEWEHFLTILPIDTPIKFEALTMSNLQVADGPLAYLKLTAHCLKHRHRLFHTTEPREAVAILRALVHPIVCASYYRYLL